MSILEVLLQNFHVVVLIQANARFKNMIKKILLPAVFLIFFSQELTTRIQTAPLYAPTMHSP